MKLSSYRVPVLLVLAAALRIAGITFGPYHADEPIVVNHALGYGLGDLNPHFFAIPPLVSYLCFGVYGIFFAAGKIFGAFPDLAAFEKLFIVKPEIFYWIGRAALGVAPGVLTVELVRRGVRRLAGDRVAFWAALALAVNFLHVRDSHAIYTDILMALGVWMAVDAALRYLNSANARSAAMFGLWTGIATATKYNAVLVGVSGLAAWLIASRRWRELAAMGAAAVGAFALLNPFALLDGQKFLADIAHQATAESAVGFWHPIGYSLRESCDWAVLIAAAAGAVIFFRRDWRRAIVLFAFPAIFYLKLGVFSQPHERYVMPLIPFVAAAFGIAAQALVLRVGERKGKRGFAAALLLLTLVFGLAKSVYADILFCRPDTRDLAREWIEARLPAGSRIAFTDPRYRPTLWRDGRQWRDAPVRADGAAVDRKNALLRAESEKRAGYYLYVISPQTDHKFSSVWPLVKPDLAALRGEGIRYVVLYHEQYSVLGDWDQSLKAGGRLLARFSPYIDENREYPVPAEKSGMTFAAYAWPELMSRKSFGPVLEIYEL